MKKTMLSMAILAVALTGCSNNDENSQSQNVPEGTPIRVNALVGEMETRAGYDTDNAPKEFYLQITNKNKERFSYDAWMAYNSTTKAWESFDAKNISTAMPMYWAGDGQNVQVTAATFTADEMASLGVAADQSTAAGVESSDKLVMKSTTVEPTTEVINVTLNHLMTKLNVVVDLGEDDVYTENPIANMAIEGTELQRACAADTSAFTSITPSTVGDITPCEGTFTKTDKTTSPVTHAVARYEAIIVPQTVKKDNFKVSFRIGDKNYSWTATKDEVFATNVEYTLKLSLKGEKLLLDDLSVSSWGSTDDLGGGVVEEYIPWLSLAPTYTLDEAMITDCLRGSTKLRVTYTLSNSNAKVLGQYSADKITYLDLANAAVKDDCLSYLSSGSNTGLVSTLETFIMPKTLTGFDSNDLSIFTALTNVTMPEGMTDVSLPSGGTITEVTVPAGANTQVKFSGESQLKKVTITGSLTSINDDAFNGCSSLTEINLPSTVTSIGKQAFNGCSGLTEINLPSTVTSIGDQAFDGCSSLTKINLPSALTTIGEWAFDGCGALTEITVPSKVTSLYDGTFEGCTSLKTVNLSEGLTAIGENAFDECGVLTTINIPSTVTTLGSSAFKECKALATIDIPSGVTTITSLCFLNCTELTTVTCNGKIGALETNAFMGCTKLTDLYLKGCESLPNLGDDVFDGDSQLITVHLSEDLYSKVTSDNNYAAWTSAGKFTFTKD